MKSFQGCSRPAGKGHGSSVAGQPTGILKESHTAPWPAIWPPSHSQLAPPALSTRPAPDALSDSGVDLKTVQERLRHSTFRVTADLYAHVTEKLATETAEKLEKFAPKKSVP